MKKIVVLIMVSIMLLTGCVYNGNAVNGKGKVKTYQYDYDDFTNINSSKNFDVLIKHADYYGVEISCNENIFNYLVVEQNGNTLKLSLKDFYQYGNIVLKAKVYMPDIKKIIGSGSSDITIVEGFSFGHDLDVHLSGASYLVGDIESGDLNINLSGASKVTLDGLGDNLTSKLSGSSKIKLYDYPVNNAKLIMNGASDAIINTDGKISLDASGASTLNYKGQGTIDRIDLSGSSKINRIN